MASGRCPRATWPSIRHCRGLSRRASMDPPFGGWSSACVRTINPPGPIPDGPMLGYAATSRSAGAVRSGSRLVTPATIADRIAPILTTVVVRSNGNAGGTGGTAREVFKAVRVRKTRCAMRPRPFSRISAGGGILRALEPKCPLPGRCWLRLATNR